MASDDDAGPLAAVPAFGPVTASVDAFAERRGVASGSEVDGRDPVRWPVACWAFFPSEEASGEVAARVVARGVCRFGAVGAASGSRRACWASSSSAPAVGSVEGVRA